MVPCQVNSSEFKSELLLSYHDFGYNSALINTAISFYEGITYCYGQDDIDHVIADRELTI